MQNKCVRYWSSKWKQCEQSSTTQKNPQTQAYSLLRLLRRLERDEHRLGVGIARVRFVAMLYVAILWEQGLDVVEANMQG